MARLIAKGFDVLFEMHDGRDVLPHPEAAMLHDPEGSLWPKCSLLVMRFTHSDAPYDADDSEAVDYFGKGHELHRGVVDTPPSDLCQWHRVGFVRRIWYYRDGTRYPGDFKHTFGKRSLASLFRSGDAVLYSRGTGKEKAYRLELPEWCRLDDRGILAP